MKLEVQKYLEASTIHGLIYTSKRFHTIERIFWGIALMVSAICTLIVIIQLILKLTTSPIVVYLSDKSVPVSEINFPAVTICSTFQSRVPKDEYGYEKHTWKQIRNRNISPILANGTKLNRNFVELLDDIRSGQLKPSEIDMNVLKDLQVLDIVAKQGVFQKVNFSIPTDGFLDAINHFDKDFAPTLYSPGTIDFNWITNIYQYFSEVMTPFGLCVAFNMAYSNDSLNVNTSSPDFHYQLVKSQDKGKYEIPTLPRKIGTSHTGLEVRIQKYYRTKDIEYDIHNGFIIIIHDPFELPSEKSKRFYTTNDTLMNVWLLPEVNSIDSSLIGFKPQDRNCYLTTERSLKYFNKYTRNNCINECLTDFMLQTCGCVEYFMIRNSSTRICSANERTCYEGAQESFKDRENSCSCLQPCNYVKYEYEILNNIRADSTQYLSYTRSYIFFKFRRNSFNELVRRQQFNMIDFFSYVGGLLGLFAGFSVLSLFELIYWFGIKLLILSCRRTPSKVSPFDENEENYVNFPRMKKFLREFSKDWSLHGVAYISDNGFLDKIIWITFIMVSMSGCVFMISLTREKVPDSRVIALDDNLRDFENILFPAVTFTIDPSAKDKLFYDFAELEERGIDLEDLDFFTAFEICNGHGLEIIEMNNVALLPKYNKYLKAHMENESWILNQNSSVNGKYQPVFAETRTPRGLGYTFNLIDAKELFNVDAAPHLFYSKNISTRNDQHSNKIVDNLTFSRTSNSFLTIKIDNNFIPKDQSFFCIPTSFLIHQVDFSPSFAEHSEFVTIQYGRIVNVEVTPEITETDHGLKSLSPSTRECYFDGEQKLKFFKRYSQKNCVIECMTNITFKFCGCYDLAQPIYEEQNVCNINDNKVKCLRNLKLELYSTSNFKPELNCSCLPTCDSVTYHLKYYFEPSDRLDEININVHVNTENAILFRRYQQFTSSDVISYVGGLLGLFAGISMLTIIEIIYFFVVRLFVDIFRNITN